MKTLILTSAIVLLCISQSCNRVIHSEQFSSYWDHQPDRIWIGPEYWANRLQDWRIQSGKVECVNGNEPMRTLHMIDKCLSEKPGNLYMKVTIGRISDEKVLGADDWTGFLIGAGDLEMDYRRRSLIHRNHGNQAGIIAALNGIGQIIFINNENGKIFEEIESEGQPVIIRSSEPVKMELEMIPKGDQYQISVQAYSGKKDLGQVTGIIHIEDPARLTGNIALIANGGSNTNGHSFWYSDWYVKGSKLKTIPEQQYGPVMGILYTLHNGMLKMTAQMAPVSQADPQEVILEIIDKKTGQWSQVLTSQIIIPGFTAHFRLDSWEANSQHDYRIRYQLIDHKGMIRDYYYYGVIVKDPVDKEELVVAAFTGNSNSSPMGKELFDFKNHLWFPHEDLTGYVAKHQPDLLVYTGDNVYEGRPTPPDFSSVENTALDYLYKWYLFCWAHGDLTRNIPTVAIPDDHDVYHGNLWGAGGYKAPSHPEDGIYPDYYTGFTGHWQQDQGGYKLIPDLVNMIQRTQTSNLPDPYDPTPVEQNIGVYYCNLNYGRVSFAVLEDRKFKSAPGKMLPDKKVVNGFSLIRGIDGRRLDHPDAILLGDRQLTFLEDWAANWNDVDMKIAISQTIFANVSTFPDSFIIDAGTPRLQPLPWGVIPKDYKKAKDMDSNGWPQSGRNRALKTLRKGFAFMIGGDQHLGSVVHHGIDEWEDAGYSFCVPSIANLWPRRWFPPSPGENHQEGMPLYTGRYFDGLGNRITVYAVSNPYVSGKEPSLLHDRAPGYGIIRLNKKAQLITMECWPRYSDPESFEAEQFPGWPVTISIEDNYGRTARRWLPVIHTTGLDNPPVIQVIDEQDQEIIYTIRSREEFYQPKVFKPGTYSVVVGNPETDQLKTISGLSSSTNQDQEEIVVEF